MIKKNLQWLYQNAQGIYFVRHEEEALKKCGDIQRKGHNALIRVRNGGGFIVFDLLKAI